MLRTLIIYEWGMLPLKIVTVLQQATGGLTTFSRALNLVLLLIRVASSAPVVNSMLVCISHKVLSPTILYTTKNDSEF